MDKNKKIEEALSTLSDKMKEDDKITQEKINKFSTSLEVFKYIEKAFKSFDPIIKQFDEAITPAYEKAEEIKMVLDKIDVINIVWNRFLNFGTIFDGFKQTKNDQSGYIL